MKKYLQFKLDLIFRTILDAETTFTPRKLIAFQHINLTKINIKIAISFFNII